MKRIKRLIDEIDDRLDDEDDELLGRVQKILVEYDRATGENKLPEEVRENVEEWLGAEPTLYNFMRIADFRFTPDVNDVIVSVQRDKNGTTTWGGGEAMHTRDRDALFAAFALARKCIRKDIEPRGGIR